MGRAGGEASYIIEKPRRPVSPFPENPPEVSPASGSVVAEPRRLLVAGDIHGDRTHLQKLIRIAKEHDCQAILQVGDFGFWLHRSDDARALRGISKALEKESIDLFFIEGNHDSYDSLWGYDHPTNDGWPTISPRVYYAPRGSRWTWRGKRFLAVGSGVSMDKPSRLNREAKNGKPHTYWWPQEALTDEQVELISNGGEVDVIVSHDCPLGASLDGTDAIGEKTDPDSTDNRRRLRRIVDAAAPQLLLHGHYHHRHSGGYMSYPLGRVVRIEGLGMNGMGEESYLILDVDTLGVS